MLGGIHWGGPHLVTTPAGETRRALLSHRLGTRGDVVFRLGRGERLRRGPHLTQVCPDGSRHLHDLAVGSLPALDLADVQRLSPNRAPSSA
jgi:hypothetical protein